MDVSNKQKLINKIEKEKMYYREIFTLSLVNCYKYEWKLTFDKSEDNSINYTGGQYIYGPQFTDMSEQEQLYCIAHELGHHYTNKKTHPFLLKIYKYKLPIIVYIQEILAWKEAKIICEEEDIKIGADFSILKNNCLNTYWAIIKKYPKNILCFAFDIFISYYKILIVFYLIYQGNKENIIDQFGFFRYLKINSIASVTSISHVIWQIFIIYRILKIIKNIFTKKRELI